jgi:hypothetical protein
MVGDSTDSLTKVFNVKLRIFSVYDGAPKTEKFCVMKTEVLGRYI